MPYFIVSLILSGIGTIFSLWLIFDAREDKKVAERNGSPLLVALAKYRFRAESIRLGSQILFLIGFGVLAARTPGTFINTVRFVFTMIILLLALGSVLSYHSKREFLRKQALDT